MKKVIFLLILTLTLVACNQGKIYTYSVDEVEEFNKILENVGNGKTKAYDLREYEECYAGRIPGFFCSRVYDFVDEDMMLDEIVNNLSILLGKKKNTLIILVDKDGKDAEYVANKLFEKGFKNIHFFQAGYETYVRLNPNFVPETGDCEC